MFSFSSRIYKIRILQEENNSKYRGQLVVRDKNTEIISLKLLEAIFNLENAENVKCMNVTG